jgi:hypothetical protein
VAAHALVVVLYEKTESEQQSEYGVGLAAEKEEQRLPHPGVDGGKPAARCGVRKVVEVEVFDSVQKHDGQH